jgi:hypothetical protein
MEDYFHNSNYDLCLKTSQIPNGGVGVYTQELIQKGKIIDEYVGDIICSQLGYSDYTFTINEKKSIDAFNLPRCYMAMINDASHISKKIIKKGKRKYDITPQFYYDNNGKILANNCEFITKNNRVFVATIRDIQPDEELFIYYGDEYWRSRD